MVRAALVAQSDPQWTAKKKTGIFIIFSYKEMTANGLRELGSDSSPSVQMNRKLIKAKVNNNITISPIRTLVQKDELIWLILFWRSMTGLIAIPWIFIYAPAFFPHTIMLHTNEYYWWVFFTPAHPQDRYLKVHYIVFLYTAQCRVKQWFYSGVVKILISSGVVKILISIILNVKLIIFLKVLKCQSSSLNKQYCV